MSKLFRAAILFAAIVGLVSAEGLAIAPAQVKDKDTKAAPAETGGTEVYQAKDGWRFRIKSPEGKSIGIGTIGYEKKEDCLKAIETLKTALTKGKVVEIKDEKK